MTTTTTGTMGNHLDHIALLHDQVDHTTVTTHPQLLGGPVHLPLLLLLLHGLITTPLTLLTVLMITMWLMDMIQHTGDEQGHMDLITPSLMLMDTRLVREMLPRTVISDPDL